LRVAAALASSAAAARQENALASSTLSKRS
jgi:hypothetical protein